MCKRNTEVRSSNHCCCGKAINITYSEYVSVALATRHTKRMRPLIFSFVACLDLPYFSTLSHKRHDLGGGGGGWGINFFVFFFFSIFFLIFFSIKRF